ncbi:type II toxin-antitoxin system VapC family toxin [Skermania sp. ID1734]|nr:type II toxin-antitoxin system VapC family toxin [Skermania sp. ID1734]
MVVDTSALVAIMTNEPARQWLTDQLSQASERFISAPTAVELGIVLEARRTSSTGIAHRLLRDARITIRPFDSALTERALEAWRRFGKGRHRAALNLGDCFTYALADATGLPILCTGDDFRHTDLHVLAP